MAKNLLLKHAITDSELSQVAIARAAKIHETKLSQIVNGWRVPSDDERKAIAKALRRKVSDVFPLAEAS